MNLYEVLIDENIIKDKVKIKNILFDCQCALFLVDITSNESFKLMKDLLNIIKENLYPFLKKIMVLNKIDLNHQRKINFLEITDFFHENSELELDNIEVSLKTEENLDNLLEKINNNINILKNQIPINIIYETDLLEYRNKDINQMSIILIGDSAVGKTCFLGRYFKEQFINEFLTTLGVDKEVKVIKIEEKIYKLNFWDTAGQERFRSLPKKYYQNADGIFIFFDVTREESFKNVTFWLDNIKTCLGNNDEKKLSLFLIGNKIDLNNRVINKNEAEMYANNLGLKYFETSAKINLNVNEVISRMILECHMNISNSNDYYIKSKQNTLEDDNKKEKEESGCCGGGTHKKEKEKEKPKMRESLETIKSTDTNNDLSQLKE